MQNVDLVGMVGATKIMNGSWFDVGVPYICGNVITKSSNGYILQIFDNGIVTGSIKCMDGLFLSAKRQLVYDLDGFDEHTYTGFHLYDVDFSFRAYLSGAKTAVATDILIFHGSVPLDVHSDNFRKWSADKQKFDNKYQDKFDILHDVQIQHFAGSSPDISVIYNAFKLKRDLL